MIESWIGTGVLGVVYAAWDENLDREVVIKFLRPEPADDQDLRERFLADARAQASVRHEGIASVFALGELDGVPHFVMERRTRPVTPPIVVATAVAGAQDWRRMAELGAVGFAVKNIDARAPVSEVRRAIVE